MHFGTKSYLKSTRNHTAKHALRRQPISRLIKKKKRERGADEKKKLSWIHERVVDIIILIYFWKI